MLPSKERRISRPLHRRSPFTPFVRGALLVLLLFAVPALATLAKQSWYLPQSNPGHYLNIASKMQVPYCPMILEKTPLQAIAKLERPQPLARSAWETDAEPPKPSISVTVSQQHRSPPSLFL
jgi:hypothetical protein